MSRPEFVLFGDSLTQQSFESGGWGAALADAYSRRVLSLLKSWHWSLATTLGAETELELASGRRDQPRLLRVQQPMGRASPS